MSKLKIYTFDDLEFKPHSLIPGGKHARLNFPDGSNVSVVGGNTGCYGDGVITFEVWYSDEENPRGWQTKDDIGKEFFERSLPWRGMI